jgi:hypothetical protein
MHKNKVLLKIFIYCLTIEIGFVIFDLTVNWMRWSDSGAIRRMFNITREDSLASFFAVFQTIVVAAVCWIILFIIQRIKTKSNYTKAGWLTLAIFFSYMAIDDGAMLHERIGTVFKHASESELISYGWQIVIAPLFVVMGCFLFLFLWKHNPDRRQKLWLCAAIVCLGSAVCIDFIEGMPVGFNWISSFLQLPVKTVSHFSKSIEEFLEMLGMTFFLILTIQYLIRLTFEVDVTIKNGKVSVRSNIGS